MHYTLCQYILCTIKEPCTSLGPGRADDLVVLAVISFVYISDAGITKMDFVFDIIASSTLWLLLGNVLEKSRTIHCYRKQGNDAQWNIAGPRTL